MHKEVQIQLYQLIKLTRHRVVGSGLTFLSLILATGGLMERLLGGMYEILIVIFHDSMECNFL